MKILKNLKKNEKMKKIKYNNCYVILIILIII